MSTFKPVRGMRDLIAEDAAALNYITEKARETAVLYNFKEAVTPIVEPFELLSAKSGEEIRQRMFIFDDLGGRKVALRPEFTASIARLATTSLRNEPKPFRLFSTGSVYRYDEPQKGRYREFWQANYEIMGSNRPEADAEIILTANSLLKKVGLKDYALKLGHVGVLRALLSEEGLDERTQSEVLQKMDKKEYDAAFKLVSSEECRNTLAGLLKLRGSSSAQTIENMRRYLKDCEKALAAVDNLASILDFVTQSGCEIENVDPAFARGLEYYTGMIFELYIPQMDIAIGGGGRYDRLIEVFGGEPTPAVGVAAGLDRIAIAMHTQKTNLKKTPQKRVVVVPIKEEQRTEALKITQTLRDEEIPAEFEIMGRRMVKALEDADKRKLDYAVIVGERELKSGKVVLKDLKTRTQNEVEITKLSDRIKA
jgi:histidyl-tRNA synthetase